MNRLLALLKKEFIQMRRDRLTLVILLIMPVVQLCRKQGAFKQLYRQRIF